MDGIYEKNSDGSAVKYYDFAGRRVAMRKVPPTGPHEVYYLLPDHLGGTVEVLDANGVTVWEQKYYPFGAVRSGAITQTDKLFTGQQRELADPVKGDPVMGLYNYGARFYSTTLGRFLSVDPMVGGAGDLQSWNAYTYVRNNPLRLVDPTGMITDVAADLKRESYCGKTCQGLRALATAGLDSPEKVRARQAQRELAGALLYIQAQNKAAATWIAAAPVPAPPIPEPLKPGTYNFKHFLEPLGGVAEAIVTEALTQPLGTPKSPNNYSLGEATVEDARNAHHHFLGEEGDFFKTAKGADRWVSKSGLRQVRGPEWKGPRRGWELNFQRRATPDGPWLSNGHLKITDIPPPP